MALSLPVGVDLSWEALGSTLQIVVGAKNSGSFAPLPEDAVVTVSARSALDAVLRVLGLRAGDEILFTPNVEPMQDVATALGLTAVSVDVDPATLEPDLSSLERAIRPRTRALVVAQLFGARANTSRAYAWARRRRLWVIEDCAQAFDGTSAIADDGADVTLESFGTLKTASVFGGGLARVRDPQVRARVASIVARRPTQSMAWLARGALVRAALTFACTTRVARMLDARHEARVATWLTTCASTLRPGPSLEAAIRARVATFDRGLLSRRTLAAHEVIRRLPPGVLHVGGAARSHTHWAVPIAVQAPNVLVARLRREGFVAARRLVTMAGARPIFDQLVFLPFFPRVGAAALDRLVALVGDHAMAANRRFAAV